MNDAILLFGASETNANLLYRTRFLAGDPFAYAEADGRSMLIVNAMEKGRAQKESSVRDVCSFDDFGYLELAKETNDRPLALARVLQRVLRELGSDSAAVESTFPVLYADLLRQEGVTLSVDPELLALERRRKTMEEIAAIEEAQRATEKVMAHAIDIIANSEPMNDVLVYDGIPLTSERLRSEIELFLMRHEMDPSLAPIVAGGPGAADPHFLGAGPLRPGEAIVLDIFPRSKRTRYFADMTRTVVKGTPSDALRAMYEATSRALDAALSTIRASVTGKEVHQAVLDTYARAGYGEDGAGPRMIHGTGHGVGLEIHERPNLGSLGGELLPGDAITVEPGLYDPSIGGVRLEDLVIVTDDGHQNLTRFPRQFEV
jgi:Xaa-Pro aminopeptidase